MDGCKKENWYSVVDSYGALVGFLTDITQAVTKLRSMKLSLDLDPFMTIEIQHDARQLRYFCDRGRLVRPLLVVENLYKIPYLLRYGKAQMLLSLMSHGCIEYVSPEEERNMAVACNWRDIGPLTHSHLEVSDVSFVGILACMAPFFRHNQGPRLVYWIGMSKQTIEQSIPGEYGAPSSHSLWYGQKPLVSTSTCRILNNDQRSNVTNCTIIVFPMQFNQEDAIIVNQASVDRGMFVSDTTRVYSTSVHRTSQKQKNETFELPNRDTTLNYKLGSYRKIGLDGLPKIGDFLQKNDVVIGKTAPIKLISPNANINTSSTFGKVKHKIDKSVQVRRDESGWVSNIQRVDTGEGEIINVKVRTTRVPEVGDKFSSRHAQKGTIGRLESPENLPFSTRTGIIPDIVMSPFGFPSRMTIGKLFELLLGKAVCVSGDVLQGIDQQFFNKSGDEQFNEIRKILKKGGFAETGKEVFCDGTTGKMIEVPVLSGFVSYVKLNHLVSKKAHARATGPYHYLTNQPTEGRSKNGGLRFGPMEAECTITHAATEILRERTLTVADEYTVYVCSKCGYIADGNKNLGYYFCRFCRTGKNINKVILPYTSKLMLQELNATGIKMRLLL